MGVRGACSPEKFCFLGRLWCILGDTLTKLFHHDIRIFGTLCILFKQFTDRARGKYICIRNRGHADRNKVGLYVIFSNSSMSGRIPQS